MRVVVTLDLDRYTGAEVIDLLEKGIVTLEEVVRSKRPEWSLVLSDYIKTQSATRMATAVERFNLRKGA